MTSRRDFIAAGTAAAAAAAIPRTASAAADDAALDHWQRETDRVTAETYRAYLADGDTRGFAALERLERAFDQVKAEAAAAKVGAEPAVWCVYNMGFVVKTAKSLFSIDLVHRRAAELAPMLDFALVTHNHGDHWRQDFYRAMDGAGKTVVSNFLDNYGAADWRKGGPDWAKRGGYARGERELRIGDVEIRTSLTDHNGYLVDFTTAFEIKAGGFVLYHTGDSGWGTEPKLSTKWGRPDLWLFFPGCGIDVANAVARVKPRRIAFGHLWELGHSAGRLDARMVRAARGRAAAAGCADVSVPLWGERV